MRIFVELIPRIWWIAPTHGPPMSHASRHFQHPGEVRAWPQRGRATQVRGKNIENATLLHQDADFQSKMHHIHCLLHKEYVNICSNGVGLFADLAADINSHKVWASPGKTMFLSKSGWVTILMYLTKTGNWKKCNEAHLWFCWLGFKLMASSVSFNQKRTKATNTTITQSCYWYLFNTECHTTAFASISILVYLAWVVCVLGVARQ